MTYKASIFCPYCHRFTALSVVLSIDGGNHTCVHKSEKNSKIWWMGMCNSCKEICLVVENGERVFPHPLPTPTDERIPENLKNELDEAKTCFSVGAYRGCAVLARRVVQSCCIDKGSDNEKKLYQQINQLYENRVITEDIKNWATTIRWIGNDAAHPTSNLVDKDEAEDVLKLAEQFLHIVYVTSAIAKERIKSRSEI
ncbi:hypothetical protein LCGC14_0959950 [marine sediment metagenome]|uniref:DUF4145 domain-containing protein n=1 Tax=marine sediment metagenome TaxID=412755 RepID=A0A0F9QY08_9ZZZZ